MRIATTGLTGVFLAALAIPGVNAQTNTVDQTGKMPVEAKFQAGGQIRMTLCSSGAHIVAKDTDLLRVTYNAPHGSSEDVRVQIGVSGENARIRVTGCPHNNFELTIEIPKSSNLHVRMFAGQLDMDEISGDKDVEMHAGELNMNIGKPEDYRHVDASVLTGEVDAPAFNVSKGGLFRSFDQNGPGKYRLHAHVGAGQLDLR